MLPIPNHLKEILVPTGEDNNEFNVSGSLRCQCGHEHFGIHIFADTEKGFPRVGKYRDDYALVIKAVCRSCQREHLIFDDSKHGWNGFVCHDGITVPDEELKEWLCPKCSGNSYRVSLTISSQGQQDFIDESGIADGSDEFQKEDWVDGFEGIGIGLECDKSEKSPTEGGEVCSYKDEQWIAHETM